MATGAACRRDARAPEELPPQIYVELRRLTRSAPRGPVARPHHPSHRAGSRRLASGALRATYVAGSPPLLQRDRRRHAPHSHLSSAPPPPATSSSTNSPRLSESTTDERGAPFSVYFLTPVVIRTRSLGHSGTLQSGSAPTVVQNLAAVQARLRSGYLGGPPAFTKK